MATTAIVCDSNLLIGIIVVLGGALIGCVIYIWKGGNASIQKLAANQAECIASLPERFVSVNSYRDDIKEIYHRQASLRERLPKDFIMRSEADIFLGAISRLEGAVEGLRQGFESRMDRILHILLNNGYSSRQNNNNGNI